MNRLQIAQRVRQEAGISGSGPVTTIAQTGEMGKIVDWVDAAYQDIQNLYDWNFLRFDFSFPTIASSSTYTPTAAGFPELAKWKQDSMRIYLIPSDESIIYYQEWDYFRDSRLIGTIPTGRPSEFSTRPDKSIVLWQTPNAIFTVVGEYFKRAQTMTANADEPNLPSQFHMAIVWKAVQYYAGDQGAAELYAIAHNEYTSILRKLKKDQLPLISMAGSLV